MKNLVINSGANVEQLVQEVKLSKDGSIRSLATGNVALFEKLGAADPTTSAWNFAKIVREKYGDSFNRNNAIAVLKESIKSSKPSDSKPASKPEPKVNQSEKRSELDKKAVEIASDKSLSINEIARKLGDKFTVNAIAKALTESGRGQITAQRVLVPIRKARAKAEKQS